MKQLAVVLVAFALSCGGADWEPLFNGEDLTGWENVGDANWTSEDGSIVVRRWQANRWP